MEILQSEQIKCYFVSCCGDYFGPLSCGSEGNMLQVTVKRRLVPSTPLHSAKGRECVHVFCHIKHSQE